MMDEYYDVLERLPVFLQKQLGRLSSELAVHVQEIRLRSGRPVCLTMRTGWEKAQRQIGDGLIRHAQLQECFYALCDYSVYSYEDQISQGFFTLPGGHRVGVAGVLKRENDTLKGFQSITSLNIRISRNINAVLPAELVQHLRTDFRGLILIGPPGSGKTTLLRTLSSELSRMGKRVAVIDERMEIWPCGSFGFAGKVPLNCDVLSGFAKTEGILTALRSLGPQVILCDELGGDSEMDAVEKGARSGVSFLCSVHGSDRRAVLDRFGSRINIKDAFSCLVILAGADRPGQIQEVCWL